MINPQDKYSAILHTSRQTGYSDNRTLILQGATDNFTAENFPDIKSNIEAIKNKQYILGYFSYDLKNSLEHLPIDKPLFIETPTSWFGNFTDVKTLTNYQLSTTNYQPAKVHSVSSNMTKPEYLGKVEKLREYIKNGDIYQANLTRKFYGEFETPVNPYELYCHLNQSSPSPYSAYIKIDDLHIISTSPELFLRVDGTGLATTVPIKGSAAKGEGAALKASDKDISENLMITDLMRNDFSRACIPGSVKVDKLFEVDEFKTISHMHSVITGKIDNAHDSLDLIKNCFPPGSMTGAPKIRAMEICSELETHKRGIYSGALGYFNFTEPSTYTPCEFSVVIRTLIIRGNKFEFQVGGGITYESTPEFEWAETMLKAKPIAEALGIFEDIKKL